MRRFFRKFRYGEKGFTLIELLVVVAILGVLAAVAVPNVGKFIGKGKDEAKETELHNIQTAVMAMMADSTTGNLTTDYINQSDMHAITATAPASVPTGLYYLSDYLTGLAGTVVKSYAKYNIVYDFTTDGTVTQHVAP